MKTTLTIDDDLYWEFQKASAGRRQNNREAVETALREYILSTGKAGERMLVIMDGLDNGDKHARELIEGALKYWEPRYKARLEEQKHEQEATGKSGSHKRSA